MKYDDTSKLVGLYLLRMKPSKSCQRFKILQIHVSSYNHIEQPGPGHSKQHTP